MLKGTQTKCIARLYWFAVGRCRLGKQCHRNLPGIKPFIPITKEQFALDIGLLFFTPPPIPDAVVEKVNDYNIRNRHYD